MSHTIDLPTDRDTDSDLKKNLRRKASHLLPDTATACSTALWIEFPCNLVISTPSLRSGKMMMSTESACPSSKQKSSRISWALYMIYRVNCVCM